MGLGWECKSFGGTIIWNNFVIKQKQQKNICLKIESKKIFERLS